MRKGGGKQKGSAFERQVCVALSRWVSAGSRDDCFWRSAMSGGRATVRNKQGRQQQSMVGDISAVAQPGHAFLSVFVVECKHIKNLDVLSAFTTASGQLFKFWKKLKEQSEECGRKPLLIAKQNRYPALVFIGPEDCAVHFGAVTSIQIASLRLGPGYYVAVYLLDDLLHKPYAAHRFGKVSKL